MKNSPQPTNTKQAFTLVELLISSALALLILGGVFAAMSQHQKTFQKKNIEQELQQNVRTAMMFMQRDLRYAGSGLTMGYQDLDDWFGLPSTVNSIPWIISTGNGKDEVTIAGITGEPVAETSAWVNEGDTTLPLTIRPSTILPYIPKVGDVLLLQGIEPVKVHSVVSNTEVTVSRDPLFPNNGVHLVYPQGVEVFQLNVIKYWIADVEGIPTLLRDDSRFIYESDADRVVADGIEELNISRTGDRIDVEIKGLSRKIVQGLTQDEVGDSHVRYELTSSNHLRNTQPYLSIQGWPSDILYASADDDDDDESEATPTPEPTPGPTPVPTAGPTPTPAPTAGPTPVPTAGPTPVPTAVPTPVPTPDSSPGNSGSAPGQVKRPKKNK